MTKRKLIKVGKKHGTWTCVAESHIPGSGAQSRQLFECDCGTKRICLTKQIRDGLSSQCLSCKNTVHGDRKIDDTKRLYRIHRKMLERCNNPNGQAARWYHDKGIKVLFESYGAFREWALDNGYTDDPTIDITIDRIDSAGHYEPSNCQWITRSENSKKRHEDRHAR